jgi:hypothetical protein
MPDLLDRITHDIQRRLEELRPLVREAERLEAALTALGADTATSPSSATPTARAQPSARAAPTGRRPTRRPRQPAAGPAASSSATRTRRRAPRGQNHQRVLGVLRERPGATAAEVASVSDVQRSVVYGVLRKLEVDGEVQTQELPSGTKGYAIRPNEPPPRNQTASATPPSEPEADTERRQVSVPATSPAAADATGTSTQRIHETADEPSAS